MKKYIVKQVYNEDNSIYFENVLYDIENNFNDDIMIGFNKDYKSINFDVIDVIKNDLINYNDYEISGYYKNNIVAYIIDYLKPHKKINVKQALKIIKRIKEYQNSCCYYRDAFYDLISDILSFIYCKHFNIYCMRGYCQSDWIYCFYSDDVNYDFIQYIEAVFFNTGIELYISENKLNIDEIENINDFDYDGYYEYMQDYYLKDNLLNHIAEMIGCAADEIQLFCIENITTKTVYNIEYKQL